MGRLMGKVLFYHEEPQSGRDQAPSPMCVGKDQDGLVAVHCNPTTSLLCLPDSFTAGSTSSCCCFKAG